MLSLSRRRIFGLFAAPAIVRASSLMSVSVFPEEHLIERAECVWADGFPVFSPAIVLDLLPPSLVWGYKEIPPATM